MKKIIHLLFATMITVFAWQGTAQVITVGVGSNGGTPSAGTQVYPLGNHKGFERSASIYTYSQVSRYGVIRGIAWHASEGGKGERPIKIYMQKNASTTYGTGNEAGKWANRIAGATLVYNGMLNPVVGWNMITLTTPFVYDAQYLEVLVEANYGGTGNGGGATGNKIRYDEFPTNVFPHATWSNDNTPPTVDGTRTRNRPQIQLDFTDNETMTVASGFNQDVIAEGSGYVRDYVSIDFDNTSRYLYSETYKRAATGSPNNPPAGTGLPANGLLANLLSDGPAAFKLNPYNGNNVLQLAKNTSGTLAFSTPKALQKLYLLHASGNGPTTVNGIITFADNSTQAFSAFSSPDWVTGPTTNIAYKKLMRVLVAPAGITNTFAETNTNFYQNTISINETNFHKKVKSITLTCTEGSTNGRFNLMAVSGKASPKYIYQDMAWKENGNPSGVSTSKDDILVINGSATLSANTNVKNLTIRSGATLEIGKVLYLSGNITNDGKLVFLSNATGNGELGPVPSNSVITGNATVQRYTTNVRSYRMVSSAVTTTTSIHDNWQEGVNNTGTTFPTDNKNPNPGFGTHITGSKTGANGFDATQTGASSMYTVTPGTQDFVSVPNTNGTLKAGEPYLLMVRGDRSLNLNSNSSYGSTVLRATGALVKGDQTQNFSLAANDDFVMFGNPYQSTVDVASVFANSTGLNERYYYVYDPNVGDSGKGGYVTVDLRDGTNSTRGVSAANQYLQPGQGAQVKVTGSASIVFKESNKAPGNFTSTNRNTMSGNDNLSIQLYTQENFNTNGRLQDSFVIRFAEGYDNDLTDADAVKPMNFAENLGVDLNGTYLSIESRDMPQPSEIYQLYTAGYQHSEYTLKLTIDGLNDTALYLDDHFTGTSTLLEAGDNAYSFNVDNTDPLSKASDRFSIRIEQRLGVNENNLFSDIRLFPNPINDNSFNISAPRLNGETVVVSVNDMLGREVFNGKKAFSGNTVNVELSQDLKSGIYVVTISANGESQSLRVIKR